VSALARDEENTSSKINWFLLLNSVLTNAYSMVFRVMDITSGPPGTQVFPASGWEDVSASPGRFATGCYYAYDNSESAGWTPGLAANLGTHRVEWRWQLSAGGTYHYGAEDVEVVAQAVETADWLTIQDLYNLVGSARVIQLFDDELTGGLNSSVEQLQAILRAAEGEAYSRMLRGWSKDNIEALAGVDIAFRNHVAWVALEFASERRPAFASDDGKGQFWAQYERAIKFFESLSKGQLRSAGESAAGAGSNTGGKLRPTSTAKQADSFIFAPSQRNPTGSGGF
jgi:hypothetical protein